MMWLLQGLFTVTMSQRLEIERENKTSGLGW